jgi:cardiolipin synthase
MVSPLDRTSIEEISGCTFTDGNSVELLYKGLESFDAIFDCVKKAKSFICLQFYIFRNDETGTDLSGILKRKANEGIRVYVIYDHFGSIGTPRSFWRELRNEGIIIRASRPFKWSSPFDYPRRDHRKLIIIDGVRAFTGGLNIANEYRGFHLRSKGGWRDTGIILKGPIVSELFDQFNRSWQRWRGEPLPFPDRMESCSSQEGSLPVIPIFASSAKGRRRMRKLLYYSIHNARKSICLTTAYFTPSRRMISSLEGAVKKGVEVRLLVPGKSDVPMAQYAGRFFFMRLLRAGVRIFDYQTDMLHAKSYVFDGRWSIVGSANLDFQSLRWNDEGNVGILDEGFAAEMTDVFNEDLRHSVEIKEDEWAKRSAGEKLKEKFSVLFRRRL